jgi:hypothetical protein
MQSRHCWLRLDDPKKVQAETRGVSALRKESAGAKGCFLGPDQMVDLLFFRRARPCSSASKSVKKSRRQERKNAPTFCWEGTAVRLPPTRSQDVTRGRPEAVAEGRLYVAVAV